MRSKKLFVVKYGGSVLEGGPAIRRTAEAIKRESTLGRHVVVVVSTLKCTPDKLLLMARPSLQTSPWMYSTISSPWVKRLSQLGRD